MTYDTPKSMVDQSDTDAAPDTRNHLNLTTQGAPQRACEGAARGVGAPASDRAGVWGGAARLA